MKLDETTRTIYFFFILVSLLIYFYRLNSANETQPIDISIPPTGEALPIFSSSVRTFPYMPPLNSAVPEAKQKLESRKQSCWGAGTIVGRASKMIEWRN